MVRPLLCSLFPLSLAMGSLNPLGFSFSWEAIVGIFVAPLFGYWLLSLVYARTFHPLANIPGPLWPSVSRTWLMYRMYVGDLEIHQRALHERFVRATFYLTETNCTQ